LSLAQDHAAKLATTEAPVDAVVSVWCKGIVHCLDAALHRAVDVLRSRPQDARAKGARDCRCASANSRRARRLPEQVTGSLYTDIRIDRESAARFGIAVGDIQNVIETAVGEKILTTTIEGRRRFPVRVR